MKEDFDRLEKLLKTGDFQTLDSQDKLWVEKNLSGEEAFSKLQRIVSETKMEREKSVHPGVKADLMNKFHQKHQPQWKLAFQWSVPAYAAGLFLIVCTTLIYFLVPTKERVVEKLVLQDPVIDTVFVASKPDTVFIEQTVEVPVYVTVYKEVEPENLPTLAGVRKPKGKSLADQSDIKDILVSGR